MVLDVVARRGSEKNERFLYRTAILDSSRTVRRDAVRLTREMGKTANERKSRIQSVISEGSLTAVARLIRDLTHLSSVKNLTVTEQRALKTLTERFTNIWSICLNLEEERARQRLSQTLAKHLDNSRASAG